MSFDAESAAHKSRQNLYAANCPDSADVAAAEFDALTGFEDLMSFDDQSDLKDIVDSLLCSPPSACLGRVPSSRLMMAGPKHADVDIGIVHLDTVDAVKDGSGFTRVGRKGDETEAIPGLLGTGMWRRLKGGITMDSGCSSDTVPTGHAPNVAMGPARSRACQSQDQRCQWH